MTYAAPREVTRALARGWFVDTREKSGIIRPYPNGPKRRVIKAVTGRSVFELEDVHRPNPYAVCVDREGTIIDFADHTGLAEAMGIVLKPEDLGRLKLLTYLDRWPLPSGMRAEIEKHCEATLREGVPFELHADISAKGREMHVHISGQRCESRRVWFQVRDETALTHGKRELDEALHSYQQSIGLVAHEFKSPLVTIGGFARIMLRNCADRKQQDLLHVIVSSVATLEEIVDIFLNTYRIETRNLGVEKKEVDVYKEVIAPALADVSPLAVEHQVVIDHNASLREGEVVLKTDPSCLKTVYRNLFSNAIRYGGKRARVAYGIEDGGTHYQFNVWNSGSGIPAAEAPKLFKRFSRLDCNKGKVKGSGLGLYNTKGILDALGGKIWVHSDGHSWTNFIFTLPKE